MSKTTTTARIRPDGRVAKVSQGGKETPFSDMPMRPMTTDLTNRRRPS